MSKHLIQVQEVYRVDSEPEATALIEEAKNDGKYDLTKYQCERKETKEDEYFKLTMVKTFDNIKDPIGSAEIVYEV